MRVELVELLRSKPIAHPTRITSVSITRGFLQMFVRGYPWWLALSGTHENQDIVFSFKDVVGGCLELDYFGRAGSEYEALDDFEVHPTTEFNWAQPDIFSIFCSSPLKHPLKLYVRLHDYLQGVNSYRDAEEFLNFPSGRLDQFITIVSSNSFLVARCPECVRRVICDELEDQGIAYNIIETPIPPNRNLLVWVAGSHFLCAEAFAEFDL